MAQPVAGKIGTLLIPNGTAVSNTLRADMYDSVTLFGISTTDGAITYRVQVTPNGTTWYDLGAANVVPALQGRSIKVDVGHNVGIRISSSANVTAARSWDVVASV